jgi:tRNA-splicing ligase RtcB
MKEEIRFEKIDDWRWKIPKTGKMRVPGLIYASEEMLMRDIKIDESPRQVANVAHLPGIVGYSLAMPDIHWGYGFPIGGVAAFDWEEGVVSPGGVGYDINCGCRLLRTDLEEKDIRPKIKDLVMALFRDIPSGVGSKGSLKLTISEEKRVCIEGSRWAIRNGYGSEEDLERTEDHGCIEGADPEVVSQKALERGQSQLGTLGSGNHFLEIDVVQEIFDQNVAEAFGLWKGQIVILIHSGSRGFGYQVCDDFLAEMTRSLKDKDLDLPDRQLACAYIQSSEGERYIKAMACAANYAWANRQMLMHWTRETLQKALGIGPRELNLQLVYDVCHNIAKREKHLVDGKEKWVCVHRKGATRAFPAGHPMVPEIYRKVGQPVLIPGDMGRYSFVLVGTQRAMEETFGSTCHGAGRLLSRAQAKKTSKGRSIQKEMEGKGIYVMAEGRETLAEEIPEAYKDVSDVVDVVHQAGISRKVAKLAPLGVVKG